MKEKPSEWIAISDLMAGVVGVIMLLFVVMASLQQSSETQLEDGAELLLATRAGVIKGIVEAVDGTGSDAIISFEDEGVIRIPSDEMFPVGSAELSERGAYLAEQIIKQLNDVLPCYSGADIPCADGEAMRQPCQSDVDCVQSQPLFEAVFVEGHADATPNTGTCDNWCLSAERARAVYELAGEKYPDLLLLKNGEGQSLFGLAAYGATRPIADFAPEDSRQRRVEVRFILSATTNLAGGSAPP